ncbi:hypothetical protein VNO77_08576 [Canavalia gladiata]|uniref:Uncharacterized protein n=1 Tax=Canavalia gladiata TaxID=3824 RepID=A0AAN9R132_CANGL
MTKPVLAHELLVTKSGAGSLTQRLPSTRMRGALGLNSSDYRGVGGATAQNPDPRTDEQEDPSPPCEKVLVGGPSLLLPSGNLQRVLDETAWVSTFERDQNIAYQRPSLQMSTYGMSWQNPAHRTPIAGKGCGRVQTQRGCRRPRGPQEEPEGGRIARMTLVGDVRQRCMGVHEKVSVHENEERHAGDPLVGAEVAWPSPLLCTHIYNPRDLNINQGCSSGQKRSPPISAPPSSNPRGGILNPFPN